MEKLVTLLLENPERFTVSEVPCCLLALWEVARSDAANDEFISMNPRLSAGLRAPALSHLAAGNH